MFVYIRNLNWQYLKAFLGSIAILIWACVLRIDNAYFVVEKPVIDIGIYDFKYIQNDFWGNMLYMNFDKIKLLI